MRLFFICIALITSTFSFAQEVKVGNVSNKIVMGPLKGSQELTFGVRYLTNQILQYEGYTVSDDAETVVDIEFLYFDVKKTSVQIAVMSRNKDKYQITVRAYLRKNGKTKKKATVTEYAVNKSKSAIIIDKGGPLFSFGQDIYVNQKWKEDVSNIQVGDTITLQLQWVDIMEDAIDPSPTLIQIDWEYNTNLLQLSSHQFIHTDNPNASNSFNSWLNYNFTPNTSVAEDNLSGQHTNGLTYPSTQGWGINRATIQDSDEIIGNTGSGDKILLEVKYTVKDLSTTSYTDYTNLVTLNWATFRDNRNSTAYSVFADPLSLDLANVVGSPAGTITFQLETPNVEYGTDYRIVIEPLEQYQSTMNGDPLPSGYEYQYIQGSLNSGGQFVTSNLKQGVDYIFNIFVKETYNETTQTQAYPQWLDDVVTVSDVMQVFLQAIGTNPDGTGNHFEYELQRTLGNVDQEGPNDPLDFQDSYALLAHIAGVLNNTAGSDGPILEGQEFYPITSFNNGAMNLSGRFEDFGKEFTSEEDWLQARKFKLVDGQPITYSVAHGLMGDADLSHSTTPPLNLDTEITAMDFSKGRRYTLSAPKNIMSIVPQEDTDLDVVSQFVDGKVVVEINLTKEDLAGMQFNISYDKTILAFEDITFDTGNTMTNFAKHFDDGRINFGSINIQEENVKPGKPFKLVFTPKVSIQNTVGLVNFRVTDAVKHDGTKVNLNIQ